MRRHGTTELRVFALAAVVLLLHAAVYLPFLADDTLISLRYAERFAEGKGLTWNDGEHVEGYSNLLYVLVCALVGKLGMDLVLAVRVLGIASALAALAGVVAARRGVVGALILALSGPLAAWAVGGLEQPLLLALLTWAMVFSLPLLEEGPPARLGWAGFLYGLVCLTRPDGALLVVACVAGLWLEMPVERRGKRVLSLLLFPAVFVVGQLVFRRAYYGEWIPNTARIKVEFSAFRLAQGAIYAAGCLYAVLPLFVLPRKHRWFYALPMGAWALYVTIIGGDVFPASRHLVPLLAPLSLGGLCVRWSERRVAYGLLAYVFTQTVNPGQWRALLERWEWDGKAIGVALGRAFAREQPLVAVEAGGAVPYWSKLPAIDMLGLNDHYIAHHPPPDAGHTAKPGHDFGDGRYVFDRSPDLVLLGRPDGSDPEGECRSAVELVGLPEFRRRYVPVRFQKTLLWIQKDSARIGIQRSPERLRVPGYLLRGGTLVTGDDGTLLMRLSPEEPGTLQDASLREGPWRVEVDASGPTEVTIREDALEVRAPSPVDVRALTLSK